MIGSFALVALVLAGVGLAAGLALLYVGLRGRRVGDHPVCRKCGRDLFGVDAPTVCPECGADLAASPPKVGNRVRRRRLIAAGAMLAAPCVLWLGGVAAISAGGVDANRYKPVWLLAREAGGAGGQAAVAELRRRLDDGEMSKQRAAELVASFLDDQAEVSQSWARPKGTFVEAAAVAGLVPLDEWQRYVTQGAAMGLRSRPKVRAGEAVPLEWSYSAFRFGGDASPLSGKVSGGTSAFGFLAQLRDADGRVVGRKFEQLSSGELLAGTSLTQIWPREPFAGNRLTLTLDAVATWPIGTDPYSSKNPPPPAGAPAAVKVAEVEIVPADQPTAAAVESAAMRRIFAEDTVLRPLNRDKQADGESHVRVNTGGEPQLELTIQDDRPTPLPVPMAAEVWAEWQGGRCRIGKLVWSAGRRVQSWTTFGDLPADFDARTVTIRLTPSLKAAESTPDIVEYWGDEWVWEDVTVDWPDAAKP